MKLNCEIKVKNNFKNFEKLKNKLVETVQESVEEVLKNIRGYAIKLEKGNNEDGILVEMIETSTNTVKGRVYAEPEKFMAQDNQGKETCYLFFEYFGTGAYAEKEHVGKTTHFKESGYTEWYIPVNNVKRKLSYPIIKINGIQFYVAHRK